jgi:hypothetical protein
MSVQLNYFGSSTGRGRVGIGLKSMCTSKPTVEMGAGPIFAGKHFGP